MRHAAAVVLLLTACSSKENPPPVASTGSSPPPSASASAAGAKASPDEVALRVAEDLVAGRYDAVVERFDETMTEKLSVAMLEATWKGTTRGMGEKPSCKVAKSEALGNHHRVGVACAFARADLRLTLAFDEKGRVAGLFLNKVGRPDPNPPAYADPSKYEEEPLDVTGGVGAALPGTLTLPKDRAKPVPAVVLVHGSGPNDRDESVGGARPFRDLALGLATRGVAVLRYEKRTFGANAASLAKLGDALTLEEETVADAVAAVKLLAARKDVSGVFVVGHSLGGMAAPRITKNAGKDARGFVSLAGSTRPLEDLVLEQSVYLAEKQGRGGLELVAIRLALGKQVSLVKDPKLSTSAKKEDLPLGLPAAYWLALRGYDPPGEAKKLGKPALILQGGRDYQVTKADFELWKKGLAGSAKAKLRLFDDLNHLFVSGKGPSVPEEYDEPAHVAEDVVTAIADWVKKN